MAEDEKTPARVISVLGAKGGVGQTLLATNLAVSLKEESGKRVALLDFGLHPEGGATSLLNLSLEKSLIDLLPFMERLDSSLLKGYLTSHSSGIDLLTSISDISQAEKILPQYIEKVIRSLRPVYDYIIVSTEKDFTDNLIATFDNSDLIFLITTPDLLSLNQAKQSLATFQSLHFPPQIVKIVVNMSDVKNAIPLPKVKSYLDRDIFGEVFYDGPAVVNSINEGIPAVMTVPHSPFSKGIQKLASILIQENKRYIKEKKGLFTQVTALLEEYRPRKEEAALPAKELEVKKEERKPVWNKEVIELKFRIHKKLIDELDLKKLDLKEAALDPTKKAKIREVVKGTVEDIVAREGKILPSRHDRTRLIMEILDEALGLGPLEDLLRDSSITEIMVAGKDRIYVERGGKLFLTSKKFVSHRQLMGVIERIVAPLGRRIDESSPLVDARLKDGSRVNAVIPPLSLIGPALTIRKFPEERLTHQDLIKFGSISPEMVELLRICVQSRKNIVISGGTGSGKTTLLNILSSFIPHDERIVTIEDSAELQLPQEHVVPLESRPPNIEGKGAITIRRLVINSLRMRPDRIVVGECRGGEALDMLQAMNTGHDGSLTTIHSNSPRDCLSRLETLVLMAGMELPVKAIRDQIRGAINIVVQQARFLDGTRKITSITEITGFEGDVITLAEIFKYRQTGVDEKGKVEGEFMPTGVVPTFLEEVKARGLKLDMSIFQPKKKKT